MTEKLPTGWIRATLGDICLPITKTNPNEAPNTEFTYFDIGGIDNQLNRIASTKSVRGRGAPSRARQIVRKNDILFSTVRTNLRNIALIDQEYINPIASTGFAVIRPAEGILPHFLFYQLLSDTFLQPLNALQSGSSYPAVHARQVFSRPIVLAPLPEQKRIVDKLIAAFDATERANFAVRRARERLERYRIALIRDAVRGNLTRTWRESQSPPKTKRDTGQGILELLSSAGDAQNGQKRLDIDHSEISVPDDFPLLPEHWAWSILSAVAEIGSGIAVSRNRRLEDAVEVPYLRVANVLRGYLDLSDVKTIRLERNRLPQHLLAIDDILFNEGGDRDKLGRGWVWEGQIEDCIHQNHVFRARLIDKSLLNPRFVSHWGNTYGQTFFLQHATQTTNLASINRTVLSRLPIPIPPVSEQAEIMRQLDRRLDAAHQLGTKLKQQHLRSEHSRQSILSEAFSGGMVQQNPLDTPASVLLERIRTALDTVPIIKRAKRMPKAKTSAGTQMPRDLLAVLQQHGSSMTPEELFHASGHTQDSVEFFYAELRKLTEPPARIVELRSQGEIRLTVTT